MTGLGRHDAANVAPPVVARHVIERAHNRILIAAFVFFAAFAAVGLRLADLSLLHGDDAALVAATGDASDTSRRADIVDRNGRLLATSLATASLYADARVVPEPARAAAKLAGLLPDLDQAKTAALLASNRPFVWIRRALTPRQEYAVNRLGIPGLDFKREERRVYPMGPLAAHVLGFTDVDSHGIAGVEMALGKTLRSDDGALRLSIDSRIQNVMAEALTQAVDEFHALGAAGIVMDAKNGEVLALVSVPTYDPNRPADISSDALFNRATLGVYEMGSTFKILTAAMALDDRVSTLASSYDATKPIRVARFTINDYHAERRWLTLPEIFAYSSNIGAARIALDVGGVAQRAFLQKLGMLTASPIELPEVGRPLVPDRWGEIATMTIGFGHGISVTPIQLASAVAAVVNGGILYPPTILRRPDGATLVGRRVISKRSSAAMRKLFRLVVTDGTGKFANAPGYVVGGKTGTAEKVGGRRYERHALLSSFAGAFPMTDPRYVVLAIVDEPHGTKKTHGFATGGWVAAPVVRQVVERMAPMVGIMPIDPDTPAVMALHLEIRPEHEHAPATGVRRVASN